MASYVFANAKNQLAIGQLNFVNGGPYRLALMTDAIQNVGDFSPKQTWSQIKEYEISLATPAPVGYTPRLLSVSVVSEDKNADGSVDAVVCAVNQSYNVSTITASYIVIVKGTTFDNVMANSDILICALDIRGNNGLPVSSNNGVFTIRLDQASGGFLIIK